MPASRLIVVSLLLGYLFFCTVSLTMPIWGAKVFSDIKEQLPPQDHPTGLPVIHHTPEPCTLCEGIRLQVTTLDLPMIASNQPTNNAAMKGLGE